MEEKGVSELRERTTVLLVDDCAEHRVALRKVLASAYEVIEAADGNEALQMTETYFTQLAAILLDEGMPGIDGLDVLQIMQSKGWLNNIPVFLVTEEESDETMARGYELGVADILVRPLKPEVVKRRVANMVELYRHRFELERVVLEQTARIREQEERLRQTNKSIMEALSAAIEFRNCDSGFHVRRIRQVTRLLLLDVMEHYPEYGLTQEQTDAISELSIMHDIGKIAVPENILTKDGRLTADEFERMKAHTIYGGELVRHITFPQGERVQRYFYEICRHHHERWDGEGYPDGLKGEEIPIWVQAVSIADVYEALVSRRVYKPAYAAEEAVRMILEGECGAFNPKILASLRRVAVRLIAEVSGEAAEEPPEERPKARVAAPAEPAAASPVQEEKESAQRSEAQTLFLLEQEKYRIIAELSEDMVFTYNQLFDSMEFSEKFCRVFQVPAYISEYSKYRPSARTFYPEEYEALIQCRNRLTWAVPEMEMDLRLPLPDGTRPWFHLVLHVILDHRDRTRELGYVGKLTNINRIKREATEWQKRANTDALTQLYNRAGAHILFEELLLEGKNTHTPLTVAFMDIDHFKSLNDTMGHEAGDQILTAFGQSIRRLFRPDDIVSRFGGDEFLVVMKNMGDPTFVREKLKQLCRQHLQIACAREPLEISCSIGVAFYPKDGQEFDDLLRKADQALYQSKRAGRGQVSFYAPPEKLS